MNLLEEIAPSLTSLYKTIENNMMRFLRSVIVTFRVKTDYIPIFDQLINIVKPRKIELRHIVYAKMSRDMSFPTTRYVRSAKAQISLRIRAV